MTRSRVLHIKEILDWADSHFESAGQWPRADSGRIQETLDEKWINIDAALRKGLRGVRGGSSVARLLAEHRGRRNRKDLPRHTLKQILVWVDAYHAQSGNWPKRDSGPIPESPGDTWSGVDEALFRGLRGLPAGSSLARLLARRRGVRNHHALPPFSHKQILAWANAHHTRTGMWPTTESGPVAAAPGETWNGVETALRDGRRGLPRGSSLARFLRRYCGVRRHKRQPPLTTAAILNWADAYHRRHRRWPSVGSGAVREAPGESWAKIDTALKHGERGLGAGASLAKLLAERRGVRNIQNLPRHTIAKILAWADAHHRKHGKWPNRDSGAVTGAPGETWIGIGVALMHGKRGLPGGSSLARLFEKHRGVPHRLHQPKYSVDRILVWMDAHHRRTGVWPHSRTGAVVDAPGETWQKIDQALKNGIRGLPGGSSLARLLLRRRGVRPHRRRAGLQVATILRWADAYHARTGLWPKHGAGPIAGAAGETWCAVNNALREGWRGLPRGGSLARLLAQYRGVCNGVYAPALDEKQILSWAEAYRGRHGKWPSAHAGAIAGVPGGNWNNIDQALRVGARGLRGGSSLSQFLARKNKTKGQRRRRPPGHGERSLRSH